MSFTLLCIDLTSNKKHDHDQPTYRLWLDNCLIVERRFWPDKEKIIQEQLTFANDNKEHVVRLENVASNDTVFISNLKVYDADTLAVLELDVLSVTQQNCCVQFKTPIR